MLVLLKNINSFYFHVFQKQLITVSQCLPNIKFTDQSYMQNYCKKITVLVYYFVDVYNTSVFAFCFLSKVCRKTFCFFLVNSLLLFRPSTQKSCKIR